MPAIAERSGLIPYKRVRTTISQRSIASTIRELTCRKISHSSSGLDTSSLAAGEVLRRLLSVDLMRSRLVEPPRDINAAGAPTPLLPFAPLVPHVMASCTTRARGEDAAASKALGEKALGERVRAPGEDAVGERAEGDDAAEGGASCCSVTAPPKATALRSAACFATRRLVWTGKGIVNWY